MSFFPRGRCCGFGGRAPCLGGCGHQHDGLSDQPAAAAHWRAGTQALNGHGLATLSSVGTSKCLECTPGEIASWGGPKEAGPTLKKLPALGPALSPLKDSYIQSRADTMQNIESTVVELGSIFQQLAHMVKEQEETIQRWDTLSSQTEDLLFPVGWHPRCPQGQPDTLGKCRVNPVHPQGAGHLPPSLRQVFIEHLFHVRHCSRCWGYSDE